ncbi:hypothetical protein [Mesorhizobium sp. M0643]|uniref:hypothetical protein n=1 Tax=Mesorhizobium sp. M0643 TaxID=2956978 RepID=UPI00333874DF
MHAIVDDVPLGEGSLLHLKLIPQYQGYSSRIMRPVYFGVAPREITEIARIHRRHPRSAVRSDEARREG